MRTSGIKPRHIVFLFFMVFLFLFAPVRLVRYATILLSVVLIISFIISRITPYLLTVRRLDDAVRGIKRKELTVRLQIINRSFIPTSNIVISDNFGHLFSASGTFLESLPAYGKKTLTYTATAHDRGQFTIGPVDLKGTDPLGIFPWSCRINATSKVIVYPSIYEMELRYAQGLPAGNLPIDNSMYEDVTQFRSLREYIPGDDMKRINWKVSARTNKLYTMEFDANLYFSVLILLDFSREGYPKMRRDSLLERAADMAASLAFHYANRKQEIGFVTSGVMPGFDGIPVIPYKSGFEHAQKVIETIATLSATAGKASFDRLLFGSGITMPLGCRLVVVAPHLDEEQAKTLIRIKRKGMDVLMLEIESATGKLQEDATGGIVKIIPVSETGRETISG